jgi:hypothetical protein
MKQVQAALERAEQTEQPVAKAQVLMSMARIMAASHAPDWDKIEQLLKDSIAFHESGPAVPMAAVGKLELGRVYAKQGLRNKSQQMFAEARRDFETMGMTWHMEQVSEMIVE